MNKKTNILILIIILALVLLVSIIIYKNVTAKPKEQNDKFKIVTTFYPIYIMTENITQGAKNVELINMTDVNVGCLHDYTLSTENMKKIEKADVIIQNGLGLENFIDKILTTYSNIKMIDSSSNITNKIEENAHIWTSLTNYIAQVEEISNQLIEINPENAEIYKKNKEEYITKIQNLKEKYNKELKNLQNKKAICLNEAIPYLAKDVNLEIISVETNHEESSLSAEKMKELINQMKNENITSILIGDEDNMQSAQTLAKETGAKIYKLKTGLKGNLDKNAYIQDMEENLQKLKEIN